LKIQTELASDVTSGCPTETTSLGFKATPSPPSNLTNVLRRWCRHFLMIAYPTTCDSLPHHPPRHSPWTATFQQWIAQARSAQTCMIDTQIEENCKRFKRERKILSYWLVLPFFTGPIPFGLTGLLGSGESGKSTVLKQMKIILEDGFKEHELAGSAQQVDEDNRLRVWRNIRTGCVTATSVGLCGSQKSSSWLVPTNRSSE